MEDETELRTVEALNVLRIGAVLRGNTGSLPWRLVDGSGIDVRHVNLWLADLDACDNSPATLRAYAYDLLSWTRFLDTVQVSWTRATRSEVRDWIRWYRCRENPQRRRGSVSDKHRPTPGSINERTGKPYLDSSYARSSMNRRLSSLSGFYEFALESDLGPLINPVPKSRYDLIRIDAHRQHFDSPRHHDKSAHRIGRSWLIVRRALSAMTSTKRYSPR